VRIELGLKGILPVNRSFQGGERVIFLKWASLSEGKKHMYLSLQTKGFLAEPSASATLLPVRKLSGRVKAHFVTNMPNQLT
jgi:hypothetical protein